MPLIAAVWLVASLVVAFFGRNLRFGFWGYFFASVLLTPVIGLLMLIAAVPTREARRAMKRGLRRP